MDSYGNREIIRYLLRQGSLAKFFLLINFNKSRAKCHPSSPLYLAYCSAPLVERCHLRFYSFSMAPFSLKLKQEAKGINCQPLLRLSSSPIFVLGLEREILVSGTRYAAVNQSAAGPLLSVYVAQLGAACEIILQHC